MKKALAFLLVPLWANLAAAQSISETDVSPATKRYRAYRLETTEPPYGLKKVKALVKGIKPVKGGEDDMGDVRATAAWQRMTTEERFTYCMLHGEDPSQNCNAMPWLVDEEHKVSAYPAGFFGDEVWSKRQLAFLRSHRSDVVRLLRGTIRARGRVGANLKDTITYLNTNELIPDLIWAYRRDRKDQDILTVLMLLMREGKYAPFLSSTTYKKLYGENANAESFVAASEANQKLMFERAMGFYRTRVK